MGVSQIFPATERYRVPAQGRTVGDAGYQFLSLREKQPLWEKQQLCPAGSPLVALQARSKFGSAPNMTQSMPKMSLSGQQHWQTMFVAGGDHFVIAS